MEDGERDDFESDEDFEDIAVPMSGSRHVQSVVELDISSLDHVWAPSSAVSKHGL